MPTPITTIDGRDSHLTTSFNDRGSHPQPQRLQLQWPPSASVTAALSPLPPWQFQRTDANSFSKFFFPLFFILSTPSSSVVTMMIAPPPLGPADHERQHIVMVTSPKTAAGVALWHTYLAFSVLCIT